MNIGCFNTFMLSYLACYIYLKPRLILLVDVGTTVVFDKGDVRYFCKMMVWKEDYGIKRADFCLSRLKNKWVVDNDYYGLLCIYIGEQINAWKGYSEKMRAEARKTFKYIDIVPLLLRVFKVR